MIDIWSEYLNAWFSNFFKEAHNPKMIFEKNSSTDDEMRLYEKFSRNIKEGRQPL